MTLDTASGILDGYAWAENLGWLHFKGSSYAIGINKLSLTVILAGTGSGTVHSAPAGISCDAVGGCSGAFFQSWPVTLGAVPDWKSLFTGYTGDSSVATFAMDTPKTVTATFDPNNKAKLLPGSVLFASIQDAYTSVSSGTITIQAQAWSFLEDLLFSNGTAVTLAGGMDSGYNPTTGYAAVKSLTVGKGSAVIGNISIK